MPRGRPFQPGQSGNPAGSSKRAKERRRAISDALDAALTDDDGTDLLVKTIRTGVIDGDVEFCKLAASYRWGKAPLTVNLEDADGNAPGINVYLPDNGRG